MFLSGMLSRGRNAVKQDARARLHPAARWLAAVAWMGGIFYLSHQSDPAAAPVSYATSVAAHLLVYGGLAMLFCWSLAGVACGRVRESMWVIAGLAFALTVLYGAGDELHQAFVPGRVASELDLAIDAVGALLGVAAWSTYLRFLHGSSRA